MKINDILVSARNKIAAFCGESPLHLAEILLVGHAEHVCSVAQKLLRRSSLRLIFIDFYGFLMISMDFQ